MHICLWPNDMIWSMCAMQQDKVHPHKELLPEHQWKLDPLNTSCCNLFIKDILELPLYADTQENVFCYKNHPIRWVSVMGIVVKVDERAQLFQYGVDDGTGVINCTCWKPKEGQESERNCASEDGIQSLLMKMDKWHSDQLTCLEVGDLINVRGKINLYKGNKQISSFSYGKVSDPAHKSEVQYMTDQVVKYRTVYDVLFNMHNDTVSDGENNGDKPVKMIAEEVGRKVVEMSRRGELSNFFLHELETISEIYQLCCQPCSEYNTTSNDPLQLNPPATSQIAKILRETVNSLLEKGIIFKSRLDTGLFHITLKNKHIRKDVLKILHCDCQDEQYMDGCHFLHIYDRVKAKGDFKSLTHVALKNLLNYLEEQGSVIRSSNNHYLPMR